MGRKRGRPGTGPGGKNMSQLIRDTYGKLGPDTRPRDIMAALSEQGIEVSRALVSGVLMRMGKGTPRKASSKNAAKSGSRPRAKSGAMAMRDGVQRGRSPGRPPKVSNDSFSMETLVSARNLVQAAGSVAEAKRALDAVARLM